MERVPGSPVCSEFFSTVMVYGVIVRKLGFLGLGRLIPPTLLLDLPVGSLLSLPHVGGLGLASPYAGTATRFVASLETSFAAGKG